MANPVAVTISSAALTRVWIGALIYLVVLSLVGVVAIPGGEAIVIRWSWGDWTPVDRVSKGWGLSLGPLVAASVALTSIARRRATGLELIPPPFTFIEIFAILVLVAAHSLIVLVAI